MNAAVGLIAVHVIDDSFVQPQPGTSAGDHTDYFRAANEPKQIWEARGRHTDGIAEQPRLHQKTGPRTTSCPPYVARLKTRGWTS
jgi:hypothetical protein